jgi:hypothetical protein
VEREVRRFAARDCLGHLRERDVKAFGVRLNEDVGAPAGALKFALLPVADGYEEHFQPRVIGEGPGRVNVTGTVADHDAAGPGELEVAGRPAAGGDIIERSRRRDRQVVHAGRHIAHETDDERRRRVAVEGFVRIDDEAAIAIRGSREHSDGGQNVKRFALILGDIRRVSVAIEVHLTGLRGGGRQYDKAECHRQRERHAQKLLEFTHVYPPFLLPGNGRAPKFLSPRASLYVSAG